MLTFRTQLSPPGHLTFKQVHPTSLKPSLFICGVRRPATLEITLKMARLTGVS